MLPKAKSLEIETTIGIKELEFVFSATIIHSLDEQYTHNILVEIGYPYQHETKLFGKGGSVVEAEDAFDRNIIEVDMDIDG